MEQLDHAGFTCTVAAVGFSRTRSDVSYEDVEAGTKGHCAEAWITGLQLVQQPRASSATALGPVRQRRAHTGRPGIERTTRTVLVHDCGWQTATCVAPPMSD